MSNGKIEVNDFTFIREITDNEQIIATLQNATRIAFVPGFIVLAADNIYLYDATELRMVEFEFSKSEFEISKEFIDKLIQAYEGHYEED